MFCRLGAQAVVLLWTTGVVLAGNGIAESVKSGDRASVLAWGRKPITERRAEVNQALADGTTALHWAIRAGEKDTATLLLASGADAKAPDRYGVTPLYVACTNADLALVEMLLNAGVPATSADPSGETALMTAARAGKPEVVKLLLDRGADVNAHESVRGQTALMWAVAQSHKSVVQMLIARGADVNAKSTVFPVTGPQPVNQAGKFGAGAGIIKQRAPVVPVGGFSALLYAAREGNREMAELLLASGADILQREAAETNALILAIVNGHYDLALFFIEKGADINASDVFGRTPLYAAIDMRNLTKYSGLDPRPNPLDPMVLVRTLLEKGANVNARTKTHTPARGWAQIDSAWVNVSGQTPFMRAAFSGDLTVMKMLLDKGADPKITAFDGTTALMLASGVNFVPNQTYTHSPEESLEAVKLCLSLGNDLHAVNGIGVTALHGAAHRGSDEMVRFLVEKGARLDAKDKEGRTPLSYAEGVFLADNPPVPHPGTALVVRQLMSQAGLAKN
jgi:ankyrin repeat protein